MHEKKLSRLMTIVTSDRTSKLKFINIYFKFKSFWSKYLVISIDIYDIPVEYLAPLKNDSSDHPWTVFFSLILRAHSADEIKFPTAIIFAFFRWSCQRIKLNSRIFTHTKDSFIFCHEYMKINKCKWNQLKSSQS